MKHADVLNKFLSRIQEDPRIGFSHVAMFAALAFLSHDGSSVQFFAKEIRLIAKINSPRTYFKLLKDLQDCRYIEYKRGFSRWEKSIVRFCL